jgi:hypothetical protein
MSCLRLGYARVRQIWSPVGQIKLLGCPRRIPVTQSFPGWTKVTQRVLWPNYELGEARVMLGKANSVSDKENGVSQVASGLFGLA